MMKICFVLICAAALTVTACKKAEEQKKPAAGDAKTGQQKETVLASMQNGKDIVTWEEMDRIYHLERMRDRLDDTQINTLLENIVKQHLVYLDGVEKGYDKDPEYIQQIEAAKRQYINRIAMRKLNQEKIEVSDQDAKTYYDAHPDEFNMVKVKYILFSIRKYENDTAKAKADAGKALAEVKKGTSLEDIADKYLDKSRPFQLNLRKGQPSFFGAVFDDVVWNLEPGKTSDLIETPQGVIIALVEDKSAQSFEESNSYIKSVLIKEKTVNKTTQYYEELKKKYGLSLDAGALNKKLTEVKNAPAQPGGGMMPPGMPAGHPGGGMPGMQPPPPGAQLPPGHPVVQPGQPGQPPAPRPIAPPIPAPRPGPGGEPPPPVPPPHP